MDSNCLIVIISLNQLNYTKGCIESIVKYTRFSHKILVVDNGSNKETIDYLQSLQRQNIAEIIFNKKNIGWVKAVNQGLYYSNSSYVCVMNNDTSVYPGWLAEMVNIAEKSETIGLINPLWELPKRFRGRHEDYFSKAVKKQKGQFVETDWVRGFCFLVKRQVVDKIGGLDEDFSPGYYDDWDYSIRAIKGGFKCVRAKGAFVWHHKNVTSLEVLGEGNFSKLFQEKGKIFYKKWPKPLKIFLIIDKTIKNRREELKEVILFALRRQHRLCIVSTEKNLDIYHTNCNIIYSKGLILKLKVIFKMLNDVRHVHFKRYNMVVCSIGMSGFFSKVIAIEGRYSIKALGPSFSKQNLMDDIVKLENRLKREM